MFRHGLIVLVTLLAACRSKPFKVPFVLAGGKEISAQQLNDGFVVYRQYCVQCHGPTGNGKGVASSGLRPPPRNFQAALFKFAGVPSGQLPTDEALYRTLERGLHGTPMLPWDISESDRRAVIQYLKTFKPPESLKSRWQEEEPGIAVEISPDPWQLASATDHAIERGKRIYHLSVGGAGCALCHPGYLTHQELSQLSQQANGEKMTEFPKEMYRSQLHSSDYEVQILPPDFLFHKVKTAYPVGTRIHGKVYTAEEQRTDLYRTLAAGIGGAAMPQWKGSLPEEDLWALVYYVQSLIEIRDTPAAMALRQRLGAQKD